MKIDGGPSDVHALIRPWHDAIHDTGNLPCLPGELPGYEAGLLSRMNSAPHLQTLATGAWPAPR
jgi:hypothetical protein